MRALVVLALIAAPASSVAQLSANPVHKAPPSQRVDCLSAQVRHANRAEPLRPRRLDELPRGELFLSVLREVDGCQQLVRASEERARFQP